MPEFKTEIPHTLGQQAAAERLKGFVDAIRERYKDQVSAVQGEWKDPHTLEFGLTTFGITISGQLNIQEELVRVTGQIPIAALMFKGKIVSGIEEGLQRALR